MTGEPDDLPLHDEAMARSKWRGGETIIDKGGSGAAGPASEVDNASQGGAQDRTPEDDLLGDMAQRPPD